MTARKTAAKPAAPARLTPAQKLRAKKTADAAKLKVTRQRAKVKTLQAKLKVEEKALNSLLPKKARPKTNHVAGLARAAKSASEGVALAIEKTETSPGAGKKGSKRTSAPLTEDRTVKPLKFIDGLVSTRTYLIVSHKSEDKSIKLGVRYIDGKYRMHFFPNIAAHGNGRNGKMRNRQGYETIWVYKSEYEAILNDLRHREDTHNLPQELVEKLVQARNGSDVAQALASVG